MSKCNTYYKVEVTRNFTKEKQNVRIAKRRVIRDIDKNQVIRTFSVNRKDVIFKTFCEN